MNVWGLGGINLINRIMKKIFSIICLCLMCVFASAQVVKTGSLNNIAPTVLKLMNLEIPNEMDEPLI